MKSLQGRTRDITLIGLLLVISFLTRTTSLGTFLTADEKTWLGRSYEFIRAFKDVRFNDMLQTTHPGVTTLWTAGTVMTAKMLVSDVPFTNNTLFHFIKSTQISIAVLNALAIPVIFIFLLLLFKRRDFAFFSALLISLDPWLIGYSRVVHVDALLGSFLTLTVLAAILYTRTLKYQWLLTCAVLAALALLTKFPAVFIFPFILCALVVFYGKRVLVASFLQDRSRDALTWILIVTLLIFIIWPALLWVPNPFGNVLQVKRDISVAASTPHNMSEEYSLSIYHYPAALLSRSNPISLIGAMLGIVAIGVSYGKKKPVPELLLIAIYLVGFVVMMTLGAKKGDRYILPVFFALDILAAYGILWVTSLLTPSSPALPAGRSPLVRGRERALVLLTKEGLGEVSRPALFVGLLSTFYLLFVVISYHPYAIAYSNPLFPDNISQELGWGEGLDQVASWLNENHPTATVASWYPGELGPFTTANVLHINAHAQNQVQYIVLYKNMFGREPSHYANDFIDEYYKKREPVFIAHVAGKEFAWVYEKPSYSKTIGDLDARTIVVQEVEVAHDNLSAIRILAATRFGDANTGNLVVTVSWEKAGSQVFTTQIPIADLQDASWNLVDLPTDLDVNKGDHLFIGIQAVGSSAPYASVRYAPEAVRSTPMYISRTGNVSDASQKPGSLSIQLMYTTLDGKRATELETKLLH